jgi:branched-subunit amino acid transport protein
MNLWILMLGLGLLTFLTRLSFILLMGRIQLPAAFQRALRLVPIAALSAIIAPELGYSNGTLALSLANPRLLAGLAATLVAYRTKNVIYTILAGMAVFWLLSFWA